MTGSLTLQNNRRYFTLTFAHHGWLAADLVQYVDEILEAADREIAILKLLGYTLQLQGKRPPRTARHWVEVDLDKRIVRTNSDMLRKAVTQTPLASGDPYSPLAVRRLYEVLDRLNFTVKLHR